MSEGPNAISRPIIPPVPAAELSAAHQASGHDVDQAWQEVRQLTQNKSPEELAAEADEAEHGRNQRFKDQFEHIAIVALWASALSVAAMAAVWVWHLVMPSRWRWLTTEDISHLQSIATAGLLVGVMGNHFKKRLG